MVPRRAGFFVLLAWSAALYEKARTLAMELLSRWGRAPPNLCAETVVPALDDFSHAVIATFSPGTLHCLFEEAAPPPRECGHNSCSLRQALERHLKRIRQELNRGEIITSNVALLQRLGVAAPHLLSAAGDLDARGDTGMSVLQLLAWQFLPLPKVACAPLLGDTIARELDTELVEVVNGKDIAVRHLGGRVILEWYQKQEARLVQLEKAVPQLQLRGPAEGNLQLFHGTTIEAADAIIRNGIDPDLFTRNCDFGPAFYTTTSLAYAIDAAYRRFVMDRGRSAAPAVVVYELSARLLEELKEQVPELVADTNFWVAAVAAHRRQREATWTRSLAQRVATRWRDASLLHGPICSNAGNVDLNRADPPGPPKRPAVRLPGDIRAGGHRDGCRCSFVAAHRRAGGRVGRNRRFICRPSLKEHQERYPPLLARQRVLCYWKNSTTPDLCIRDKEIKQNETFWSLITHSTQKPRHTNSTTNSLQSTQLFLQKTPLAPYHRLPFKDRRRGEDEVRCQVPKPVQAE
jgi:hypothetical protein